MTQWSGTPTIRIPMTGPYAGRVRLGRFTVPKHLFVTITGSNGHPDIEVHFAWRQGRPQVLKLEISAKDDGRGIRTSDLEVLRLDAMAKWFFENEAMILVEQRADGVNVSVMPDWSNPALEREFWELDKHVDEAVAAKRADNSQATLALVAELYERHKGKGVLEAISAALGVSERTAARRVKDARSAGLLSDRKASN